MADIIRVVVVDDHLVVRKGFTTFLKTDPDLVLMGEASNGKEAVALCRDDPPDVILMDMMMPEMSGIDAIRQIKATHPQVQILALTSFNDDARMVQEAMEAGAIGYLFKDVSIEELSNAIRKAHNGMPTLSPDAMKMLIQAKTRRTPDDFNLSERELDVLRLLVEGLTNPEIADRLTISRSTVKFHVSSILGKLNASSRTEAVTIAHQHNLLSS